MTKNVNYYIWNDEPIQADYFTKVNLPNGGSVYDSIGKVTIQKGDAIIIDYGSSYMEYTRSGKGPKAEFPFGKIHLQGVPCSVVLSSGKSTSFVKSSQEDLDKLITKQQERINNFVPELTEKFVLNYMELLSNQQKTRLEAEQNRKKSIAQALGKMEAFFKPK